MWNQGASENAPYEKNIQTIEYHIEWKSSPVAAAWQGLTSWLGMCAVLVI